MGESKYSSIGRYIKTYRKANGYTQQALADKLGVERTNLAKIETGATTGSLDILIKISDLFGVSLGTLLGLNDELGLYIEMSPRLKDEFLQLCNRTGIKPDVLINLFLSIMVREQKIPFDISV